MGLQLDAENIFAGFMGDFERYEIEYISVFHPYSDRAYMLTVIVEQPTI